MTWHPTLPSITMLHAQRLPEAGGDSAFVNQHLAYETLPDRLRKLLDGADAFHSGKVFGPDHRRFDPSGGPDPRRVRSQGALRQRRVHGLDRRRRSRTRQDRDDRDAPARDAGGVHVPAPLGSARPGDLGQPVGHALSIVRLRGRAVNAPCGRRGRRSNLIIGRAGSFVERRSTRRSRSRPPPCRRP
jgi:hypothetical protein